jgi:hypothetical protein
MWQTWFLLSLGMRDIKISELKLIKGTECFALTHGFYTCSIPKTKPQSRLRIPEQYDTQAGPGTTKKLCAVCRFKAGRKQIFFGFVNDAC